jgi:hypothetical protein
MKMNRQPDWMMKREKRKKEKKSQEILKKVRQEREKQWKIKRDLWIEIISTEVMKDSPISKSTGSARRQTIDMEKIVKWKGLTPKKIEPKSDWRNAKPKWKDDDDKETDEYSGGGHRPTMPPQS